MVAAVIKLPLKKNLFVPDALDHAKWYQVSTLTVPCELFPNQFPLYADITLSEPTSPILKNQLPPESPNNLGWSGSADALAQHSRVKSPDPKSQSVELPAFK